MIFNIIQVSESPVSKDDYISEDDVLEDEIFNMHADYVEDPDDVADDRLEDIKKELAVIADVDVRKKTITFKPKDEVHRVCAEHMKGVFAEFERRAAQGVFDSYLLRKGVNFVCGIDDLFYKDYCQDAGRFLSDYVAGHLPGKLYIGAVLNAHI